MGIIIDFIVYRIHDQIQNTSNTKKSLISSKRKNRILCVKHIVIIVHNNWN